MSEPTKAGREPYEMLRELYVNPDLSAWDAIVAAYQAGRESMREECAERWDNCAAGYYEGQYIASEIRALPLAPGRESK
jgi:hypothetical protein